jgi:hypothetical protein
MLIESYRLLNEAGVILFCKKQEVCSLLDQYSVERKEKSGLFLGEINQNFSLFSDSEVGIEKGRNRSNFP